MRVPAGAPMRNGTPCLKGRVSDFMENAYYDDQRGDIFERLAGSFLTASYV